MLFFFFFTAVPLQHMNDNDYSYIILFCHHISYIWWIDAAKERKMVWTEFALTLYRMENKAFALQLLNQKKLLTTVLTESNVWLYIFQAGHHTHSVMFWSGCSHTEMLLFCQKLLVPVSWHAGCNNNETSLTLYSCLFSAGRMYLNSNSDPN